VRADNATLAAWNRLAPCPGGKYLFSKLVDFKAPYFGSVGAVIEVLEPNYARLRLRKRRAVQNHIGTVHVIAILNMLEKAMGVCAEASIPPGLRWIPKGMTLDYPAKAATDLTGIARIDPAGWGPGELPVEVTAYDRDQTVVVRGTILLWISEKKHPPAPAGSP
jgi:acyl-coenzyme A thioesterase PaaI-like protein